MKPANKRHSQVPWKLPLQTADATNSVPSSSQRNEYGHNNNNGENVNQTINPAHFSDTPSLVQIGEWRGDLSDRLVKGFQFHWRRQ
jgi:type II secretory pathway component PulF